MKRRKHMLLAVVLVTASLTIGMQGCRTGVVKQAHAAKQTNIVPLLLPRLTPAEASQLFQKGVNHRLFDIALGHNKFTKKPIKTIQNTLLRNAILPTKRGRSLQRCQFPAIQIEVDGKKETSDWLVTTRGKGQNCEGGKRNFWIIQQNKSNTVSLLLSSRGSYVTIEKPKGSIFSEAKVSNSGKTKVKNGDKLASGARVLITKNDRGYVEIDCERVYRLNGGRYSVYKDTVQANVEDWQYHGKFWRPINNPRYQCSYKLGI